MKMQFVGTGSAFTLKNFNTNYIIEENGKRLLFDCGGDIRFALRDVGLSYKDIDAAYITHLHDDHAQGVGYLGFASFFDPNKDKIKLFGNGEILMRGWEKSWSGNLESIQNRMMTLQDYFDVYMVHPNETFAWEGIKCTPTQTIHIMNGFSVVPSYGLMLTMPNDMKIFCVGDSQHCPHQIIDFYNSADLIIQDCETLPFKSGVHANYMDLKDLPVDIKKKMYLVHYQDNIIGEDGNVSDEWNVKAYADMFAGFLNKGDVLDTDRVFLDLETIR